MTTPPCCPICAGAPIDMVRDPADGVWACARCRRALALLGPIRKPRLTLPERVAAAVIVAAPVARPPTFDGHVGCPWCGHPVGYRDIHAGMRVITPHSEGKGRIVDGVPRCDGAELNIAAEAA